MIHLGIDLDNTIIIYDQLFYQLATELELVPNNIEPSKLSVRNYLRSIGKDEVFTSLQGQVYGTQIKRAQVAPGVFEALITIKSKVDRLSIVSHKTEYSLKGPKVNLRETAKNWLATNKFFSKDGLNINQNNLYFESTKELKIKRIKELECTHFIDDLPEILSMIPDSIYRIYYNPKQIKESQQFQQIFHWNQLTKLFESYL